MHRKKIASIVLLVFLKSITYAQYNSIELKTQWQFKKAGKTQWYKASVPGTVHTDLLGNKLIDDPFYRDNEDKLQWISRTDWDYKTTFNIGVKTLAQKSITLSFEGLDTYAEVFLNGQKILSANNMFRTWNVNVKPFLKSQNNELFIHFSGIDNVADSLFNVSAIKYPPLNNHRNYVRKAQFQFGWDFAPKFATCGIWRSIKIISCNDDKERPISKERKSQPVKLVQEKDSIGQSFYFTVKGKPQFIKGANWIPADVFLPRITKIKYRQLLLAAKDAGIDMLRVWGGGIYEDDYFYHLCDSLNIMVWQDFMFGCAMYPDDENFLENVKQEAIDNILRLRHHKSIVLWCGNNENDEAWKNWGWIKKFSPADSAKIWNGYLKLFHELLPNLVQEYDSGTSYITTSDLNHWQRKEGMTHGDNHYWGVWWGLQPIETYKVKIPRFMSEYGMQSLPNFESIKKFTLPADWDTASLVMKAHQKHPTGYKNLAVYLNQNKLTPTTFQEYIAATQELQSRAMDIAINAHFNSRPYCMGTMFWQFNDCWPVASWSVVDYYGNKKKAYYTVKKLYNKLKK